MRRALAVLAVLSVAGCAHSWPDAKVRVTGCALVAGTPVAVVDVTNTTGGALTYFVTVDFTGFGKGVGSERVAAGGSASMRVAGQAAAGASGGVSCKVSDVTDL